MGDSSVVLTPIRRSGHWRVKMTWPGNKISSHYFGKFNSQADAEKWIAEYRWLIRRQNDIEAANDH
jgi:hypothetical protein